MKIECYLTHHDTAVLGRLAEHMLRMRELRFNAVEQVLELLSGATLLPAGVSKEDCVSLNATVTYGKPDGSETHTVLILSPEDTARAKTQDAGPMPVSVLAPVGLALIGRKVGSMVDVCLPYGNERVRILEIHTPNSQMPDSVEESVA